MAGVDEARQPRGTGVALRDPLPWPVFAGAARLAEAAGYAAVFLPEVGGRDTLAALTGLAGETSTLFLGTGVIPMASRTPRLTAMAAATVHERSGGRAVLGIGTGPATSGALDRLREIVVRIRAILGDVEGAGLSLGMPRPIPIWIAALGPRALSTAGEMADGVLLNWCPPERVAQARDAVRSAAVSVGRDPDAVTIAVYVRASLDADHPDEALAALRAAAGEYASYPAYARQFSAVGLGAAAEAAATAHRSGRPQDVPAELVDAVALLGNPAAARRRLEEYRRAGADLPIVYPVVGGRRPERSLQGTIRALAPEAARS